MLGKVKTILSQLKTDSTTGFADAWPRAELKTGENGGTINDSMDNSEPVVSTQLFRCPSCDRVYVATDKQTCSTCNADVERVVQTD